MNSTLCSCFPFLALFPQDIVGEDGQGPGHLLMDLSSKDCLQQYDLVLGRAQNVRSVAKEGVESLGRHHAPKSYRFSKPYFKLSTLGSVLVTLHEQLVAISYFC